MSQSSNSSSRSWEHRKRKTQESPNVPKTQTKRRRGRLSIKSQAQNPCPPSPEVTITLQNNATTSPSCSIITISSTEEPTDAPDYMSLANHHEINVQLAKKYYAILTSSPKVPIIRLSATKKEFSPNRSPIAYQLSPEFGFRKRQRKPRKKTDYDDLTKSTIEIKGSKLGDPDPQNKTDPTSVTNCFDSLDTVKIKKEVDTSESSFSKVSTVQAQTKNTLYDDSSSGNEFQISRSVAFSQTKVEPAEKVKNPFSKTKKSSQNTKKSFWSSTMGKTSSIKKKKFFENFEMKDDCGYKSEDSPKCSPLTKSTGSKKMLKKKRKRVRHPMEEDSSSATESNNDQTANSLSVNYQMLSSVSNLKVDKAVNTDDITSLPLPFGYDAADQEQELALLSKKVIIKQEQTNIAEVEEDEQSYQEQRNTNTVFEDEEDIKLVDIDDQDQPNDIDPTTAANGNTKKEIDLDDSFASFHGFDPPKNLDKKTPERKKVKTETPLTRTPENSDKPKAKPKIISYEKVQYNTVLQNISQDRNSSMKRNILNGLDSQRNSPAASPKSNIASNLNSENKLAKKLIPDESKSNGTDMNSINLAVTPKKRSVKTDLSQVKMNLTNEKSVREYQMNNSAENVVPEETFDSLCKNLTQLSKSEDKMLFDSGEKNDNDEDYKIIIHEHNDKNSDTRVLSNSNIPNETGPSFTSTPRKLPSFDSIHPNRRISLSLKRKTPENSPAKLADPSVTPSTQQLSDMNNKNSMTPKRSITLTKSPRFSLNTTPQYAEKRISTNTSPELTLNTLQQHIDIKTSPLKTQQNNLHHISPGFNLNTQHHSDVTVLGSLKTQQNSVSNSSPKFTPRTPQRNLNMKNRSPLSLQQSISQGLNLSSSQFLEAKKRSPISPIQNTTSIIGLNQSPVRMQQNNSPRFINKDPRLNRTLGPEILSSPPQRDPRLNRSFDSGNVSDATVTDPRLIRGNSRPRLELSFDAKSLPSQEKLDTESSQIVDPRLRKRKEREEAEKIAKTVEQTNEMETESLVDDIDRKPLQDAASLAKRRASAFEFDQKPTENDSTSLTMTATKRRASVFARLGGKAASPVSSNEEHLPVQNELLDIVKSRRRSVSPTKSGHSDDELSIFAGDLFSSEEDSDSSPRHRKFISERSRAEKEEVMIRQQPILSIKDRLSRRPLSTDSRSLQNTVQPSVPIRPSVLSRIGFKNPLQQQQQQQQKNLVQAPNSTIPSLLSLSRVQPRPVGAHEKAMQSTSKVKEEVDALIPQMVTNNYDKNEGFNDKFYKMNAEQMLQDADNLQSQEEEDTYVTFGNGEAPTKYDFMSLLDGNNVPVNPGLVNKDGRVPFFKNCCFRQLRRGNCANQVNGCNYNHQIAVLQKNFKKLKPEALMSELDFALLNNFESFLGHVWRDILRVLQNDSFAALEKIYRSSIRVEPFVKELLFYCLETKLCSVETFIKKISVFINKDDRDMVRVICVAIKNKIAEGFCWETIKDLCQKAVPPYDMIELTLLQCLRRRKNETHLKEVYDLITNKFTVEERSRMNQSLLSQFYKLLQLKKIITTGDDETAATLPLNIVTNNGNNPQSIAKRSKSIDSIKSLESDKDSSQGNPQTIDPNKQPNNSPVEVLASTPQRGEVIMNYNVKEVDAGEPKSSYRKKFWKFYLRVESVNEGLRNKDYDHVWKELDDFSGESVPDELLRRAYYQILCKDIKASEHHITEVIKRAVRSGWKSAKSLGLLFDVGVYALIDLGDNDLWILAADLLKWVKILEPDELKTEFVIISAEIHLANNDPIEALYLLQRTKLIKTNRDEWLVKDSVKEHEKHRNQLVFLLLKALSFVDLEKAVYLFKALLADQYIFYHPIDLSSYLDKLTLLTLIHKEDELTIELSRLVMDNDLTFQKATYQELISRLLPQDEILANQLLDYAIHLGYYSDIQIRDGFTTVIMDMNYYEEEVYMMLKRLFHKLVLSVGPAISHLKPNQLRIILIFEDIPDEKRLYKNDTAVIIKDKYKNIRSIVSSILSTRFSPPIRLSRKKSDKFCKIMSRTVVDHLQHWM